MTTYNTGNPVPSTDVRDLYDNAQNLDTAVNDRSSRTWTDRLGVARQTYYGMEQTFQDFLVNSGFQDIGDYGPGLVITARNQVFRKDGEYWRAGPDLDLPYTTTGDWGTEGSLFVTEGSGELRTQLAAASGASLVGFHQSGPSASLRTVEDKLRGYLDVDDFGAIGDGLHHPLSERFATLADAVAVYPFALAMNDSIDFCAIQAALNAADSTGRNVKGSRNYSINRTIQLKPNVTFSGECRGTIRQPQWAELVNMLDAGNTAHGAKVIDWVIDGNWTQNALNDSASLVRAGESNNVEIRGCTLRNGTGYGVVCNTGRMMTVADCIIDTTYMHGVAVYGTPYAGAYHAIVRNRLFRTGAGGIILAGADYSRISENYGFSPVMGARGSRMYVTVSGTTVTHNAGEDFTGAQPGMFLVMNGGGEYRIAEKISNSQIRVQFAPGDVVGFPACISSGDWIGGQSRYCVISDNILLNGAAFGIGLTPSGNGAPTLANIVQRNILVGQVKHALVVGAGIGMPEQIFENQILDNTIYNAANGGSAIGVNERCAIYVYGVDAGKVGGTVIDGNRVVSVGEDPITYWLGSDGAMTYGAMQVGRRNSTTGQSNVGIFNDIPEIALSGWGNAAVVSNIVSYGYAVRFDIAANGTGQFSPAAITVRKLSDEGMRPAMVKATITTTNAGTIPQLWGEQFTTAGEWKASLNAAPEAGKVYTITIAAA